MTRYMFAGLLVIGLTAISALSQSASKPAPAEAKGKQMQLGNFSISLTVKDIAKSRAFYEKLGFKVCAGDQAKKWLVMQNDTANIGLFQGMFEKNMLTFNPGWDRNKATLKTFDDVRDIQKTLKKEGIELKMEADESGTGPASLMLVDPDGNPILLDQFVDKPKQ